MKECQLNSLKSLFLCKFVIGKPEFMIKEINISVLPHQISDPNFIKRKLKGLKELKPFKSLNYKIIRKSIDARKAQIKVNLGLLVSDNTEELKIEPQQREYRILPENSKTVIIVGAGPAGLFAALRALEIGLRPIVLERGKDVDSRRIDLALISREGKILEDSNYCFGEGGAGTFSDGKLYTRSKKRGNIREVLEIFHQFGAPEEILVNSHPHIGSDKLPGIIKSIRNKIIECGGQVRFNSKVEDILVKDGKAIGVKTSKGDTFYGPIFLATGHSARDTYRMLHSENIKLEPKGLAIGVRLEHPQALIDSIQYHSKEGRGRYLPAAEYSFVDQSDRRGVYSFCMCPGGVIVPAVSGTGQLVVNGMSASARSGKWANSGYVVEINPEDIETKETSNPFKMMELQENLERDFSKESQGTLNAPAQRIPDFLQDKISDTLPTTSYAPGIHPSDFNKLFPEFISKRLKEGLLKIGEKCKDFICKEGIMVGLESRTSSPIRIPRDPEKLCHIDIEDLYPMGEGSGYAGGIVSSAIDGIRCMDAYYKKIQNG